MMKKRALIFILFLSAGCASRPAVFRDAPPAVEAGDRKPSAVPDRKESEIIEYLVSSTVRHPLVKTLDTRRIPRSLDVNALDEVPASSWYAPRLGFQKISPAELVQGSQKIGPPELPLTVIKAKTSGSNPGFVVKDSRGYKYLIKMDDPDYPGFESTADFVISRLFWGFGYNVPEDYIFYFRQEDLTSDIDPMEIEKVLLFGSVEDDGRYRTTASLWLQGETLGWTAQKGRRRDDPNDTIAHENRRTLRALRMFCALTQQTGMRSDNSLDVYEGAAGQGHTVHYLLDFGEALGGHAAARERHWDGYAHFFSWHETFRNFAGLGLRRKPWERIDFSKEKQAPYFEAETFTPENWRETYPFQPMQHSRPDDDYWAAKVIAAVKEDHLRALFKAADYPDKEYADYLIRTLMQRRAKILTWAFSRVTPLESAGTGPEGLQVTDLRRKMLGSKENTVYEVRFYGRGRRQVSEPLILETAEEDFVIPVAMEGRDYLRIEVTERGSGAEPVQFHLRGGSSAPRLAGILR